MQLVHDYSSAEFRNTVIAKLGKAAFTVLTTGLGQGPKRPVYP
jgi:hypothetical protein